MTEIESTENSSPEKQAVPPSSVAKIIGSTVLGLAGWLAAGWFILGMPTIADGDEVFNQTGPAAILFILLAFLGISLSLMFYRKQLTPEQKTFRKKVLWLLPYWAMPSFVFIYHGMAAFLRATMPLFR